MSFWRVCKGRCSTAEMIVVHCFTSLEQTSREGSVKRTWSRGAVGLPAARQVRNPPFPMPAFLEISLSAREQCACRSPVLRAVRCSGFSGA